MSLAITRMKASLDEGDGARNPFALRDDDHVVADDRVHIIRDKIVCDTEARGTMTPKGASPLEIVLDATEGFIPLWEQGVTLRWRYREASLARFAQPDAVKIEIEKLLGEALLAWGDAAPIKFVHRDDDWDFEIVVNNGDNCGAAGCVLARAFFPDAGRHQLSIYPKMFTQDRAEQIETLAHEIGHVFGLRHFFALVSETAWPAVLFGEHSKFSIMNYGADSKLTAADRSDLKKLYALVWSGQLKEINGTAIRLVRPFHASGTKVASAALVQAV